MHPMREAADLLGEIAQLLLQSAEVMRSRAGMVQQPADLRDLLPEKSDALDQVVVQLARDPAALLLLRFEQPPAEGALCC